MRIVTRADLDALSTAAAASARLRRNLNIHPALEDPVQRLLIAFEPGTYVRPHRHLRVPKWELMTRLTGHAALLSFDDDGVVQDRIDLDATTPLVEIPVGTWHALVSLEPGTVLLEIKAGPYAPATPEDFADWSPPEGSEDARAVEVWFRNAHTGERLPGM